MLKWNRVFPSASTTTTPPGLRAAARTRGRSRSNSSKVDIDITMDIMRAALTMPIDGILLLSGDGDYVRLLREITRTTSKQVYVGAFSSGLARNFGRTPKPSWISTMSTSSRSDHVPMTDEEPTEPTAAGTDEFVRFVVPSRTHRESQTAIGVVAMAYELSRSPDVSTPLQTELTKWLDWIEKNVDVPDRFNRTKSKGLVQKGDTRHLLVALDSRRAPQGIPCSRGGRGPLRLRRVGGQREACRVSDLRGRSPGCGRAVQGHAQALNSRAGTLAP